MADLLAENISNMSVQIIQLFWRNLPWPKISNKSAKNQQERLMSIAGRRKSLKLVTFLKIWPSMRG
jgi:hypothetical protein